MRSDVPILSLRDVSFAYTAVPVLDQVNLTVRAREIIAVVGPNGGGKTTLLKLILGLLRPDTGEVSVFGESPTAVQHRIGYMPQYAHHDPQFPVTVMDVVLMGRVERRWGGPYSRADREAARTALAEVQLEDLSGRLFNALSGGQRQRVLIARALTCEPELLLLDEPTANVDVVVERTLYEILRDLSPRMTILMVSHDLGFVSDMVQRVICVNRRVVMHPTSDITGEVIQDIYEEGGLRMVRHDRRGLEERCFTDDGVS